MGQNGKTSFLLYIFFEYELRDENGQKNENFFHNCNLNQPGPNSSKNW